MDVTGDTSCNSPMGLETGCPVVDADPSTDTRGIYRLTEESPIRRRLENVTPGKCRTTPMSPAPPCCPICPLTTLFEHLAVVTVRRGVHLARSSTTGSVNVKSEFCER